MKGGKGKSKDASQWEPDDDLQRRFGYSRSTCMCSHLLRALNINSCFSNWWWKNCSKKRASNLLCTHADRIYSLDLPSSIWRVERAKAKMHRNGSQMMTCRPFRIFKINMYVFALLACVEHQLVTSLIGVGKNLARKEHQICFAPMLTGSTVWTFHLQYEGWKGQKQRCIAMGARWWLAGRFGYSRSTCMCSHLLRALNINSCFSNWWWKNCSKKRASNLLCTHADRIYSLDLPSSIWRVERVKPKMHRNGCKGALDRCFSVVSLRKVNFLKPDSCKTSQALHVQGIYSIDDVELVLSQPNTMRSLKDISILTGSTRLYTWFQRWKGQEQRCITTRAWRHVRGGSVYFGLCTLSVKTSPSFCYRYFTLHRYPTCPQIVTFERNYVFSDYHFWYPCENSNV